MPHTHNPQPRTFACFSTALLATLSAFTVSVIDVSARDFRPDRIPNGSVFNCANCHFFQNSGGPRNSFGMDVETAIGGVSFNVAFWNAELAAMDSDGDGFTNGEELGDPDGDFLNIGPASMVSNPGDASSVPPQPNFPPEFSSTPITSAHIGELYSYQAEAVDFEGHALTFSKVIGPQWLNVSGAGLVSGTPPEGSSGVLPIKLRVTDNGTPNASNDQDFNLTVTASFAGFQNLNFNLPVESDIAAFDQDPDNDDLANIVELLLKTDPRVPDDINLLDAPTFDKDGKLQFSLQVRDDVSGVSARYAASTGLPFISPTLIDPVVSDPDGQDGFETWTFTDTESQDAVSTRFGQFRFDLTP